MIPYSRPKRSDLYTLSQSKLLENHTLHSVTYLYNPYMPVPPPPRGGPGGVRAFRVPPLDPPLQMVYPTDVSDIILRYILQCLTLTLVH